MIAILPAAGRGTRMVGVTGGGSKEALPLGGRTVLDFVLDEAFAAGASRAIVVSAADKGDIEPIVASRPEHVDLRYQEVARGLADAIVAADEADEDAIVLLPDTVFERQDACAALAAISPAPDGAVLVQEVADDAVSRYGIVECASLLIAKILEKPTPEATASRLAVAARYRLSDRVLRLLREFVLTPRADGEYDLSTALNLALLHQMRLVAVPTGAVRFDCGSPVGYREALEFFGR